MSAYVVNDKTINDVISFLNLKQGGSDVYWSDYALTAIGIYVSTDDACRELAHEMFELNCNAVDQRYSKGAAAEFRPLDFKYTFSITSIMQAYKSLSCWKYQCSEGDVPDSELFKKMTKVFDLLAHHIVQTSVAYDKAEWS